MMREAQPQLQLNLGQMGALRGAGTLAILGLGSCVGLVLWDPLAKCAGMAHIVLPDSASNPAQARRSPGYFADTGLPALLLLMKTQGSYCPSSSMIARLYGGASMFLPDTARVGPRNAEALHTLLAQRHIHVAEQDLGGQKPRTIVLDVRTNTLCLRTS